MALKIATSTKENIRIVVREDSSIPADLTDEEWDSYVETLDESQLRMQTEPTRFVMRMTMPYDAQMKIKNEQLSFVEGKPQIRIGYMFEEVRCSLVGIENPPGAESFVFRKDDDGFALKSLIADLAQYGLVQELFAIRNTALNKVFVPTKK